MTGVEKDLVSSSWSFTGGLRLAWCAMRLGNTPQAHFVTFMLEWQLCLTPNSG